MYSKDLVKRTLVIFLKHHHQQFYVHQIICLALELGLNNAASYCIQSAAFQLCCFACKMNSAYNMEHHKNNTMPLCEEKKKKNHHFDPFSNSLFPLATWISQQLLMCLNKSVSGSGFQMYYTYYMESVIKSQTLKNSLPYKRTPIKQGQIWSIWHLNKT